MHIGNPATFFAPSTSDFPPKGSVFGIRSAESGLVSARLAPYSDSLSLWLQNFYSLT